MPAFAFVHVIGLAIRSVHLAQRSTLRSNPYTVRTYNISVIKPDMHCIFRLSSSRVSLLDIYFLTPLSVILLQAPYYLYRLTSPLSITGVT